MPFASPLPISSEFFLAEAVLLIGKQKERWPDRKAGRAHGGNAGLAFEMCGALQKRKNRQGGLKLFSVLIFWLLLYQDKSNSLRGN